MNTRRLIINADDFGLSHGITDGILRAHRDGIVTSTSLMVNQSASEYAIAQIPQAPKLSVGVHLNICEGQPVLPPSQVPSLVTKNGTFLAPELMIRKLWRCQISFREVEAEFRAQIRWMKDRGVMPTHADSHRHMHHYPSAILSYYRALVKEGIRWARGLRHRASPNDGVVGGPYSGSILRRMTVSAYSEFFQGMVLRKLFFPDSCIVLHPRYRGKLELLTDGWTAVLENLPDGFYEVGCHPGTYEAGFSEHDEICERREIELSVLTKPHLRSVVERNHIELIAYPQL
jgi:predicted glycoside hydrolase/deacetylase ChbG (UPF0249 family)